MLDQKQNSDYWDNIWKGNDYSTDNLRKLKAQVKVDILFRSYKPQESWQIVDFGCGPGYIAEEIYNKVQCKITCIDSSSVAINIAKNRLKCFPINFINTDVCSTGLPYNNFDLVVCCGIIEHVKYRNDFLHEIHKLLKPNGYLFITSSNLFSFMWPQRLVKQLFRIWPFGYQVNMSLKSLKNLIIGNGFAVVTTEIINDIGDYRILGKLDNIFSKLFKIFGRYIVLLGEKQ
jgi:2-polyprenyl-3-methyl-5-hydroxy-6-metoxy-1,4-benzoquinol methylase